MSETRPPEADGEDQASQSLWQILNRPGGDTTQPAPGGTASDPQAASGPAEEPVFRELHPEQYIPQDSDPIEPASGDASTIQRILSDPDSVSDEVDYTKATDEFEDFDDAIKEYYKDTAVAISCRDHPDREAADRCPECETYYCQDCIVVRRGRLLCRTCAETLYTPTEEQVLLAQEQGLDRPMAEVTPEEAPEFQVGGVAFGIEGAPAHPLKRLLGLAIDMLLTRTALALLLMLLGVFLESSANPIFHLFDTVPNESTFARAMAALFLVRPAVPWLIVIAVVDFTYFFLTTAFYNRTFGMSWVGCRVVTEWGDYVSFGAVALRVLVFMVCFGWPAILIGIFFPAYRGPHDYAAGTLVINYAGVKRVDAYETIQIKL